jgi:hypothetical protein
LVVRTFNANRFTAIAASALDGGFKNPRMAAQQRTFFASAEFDRFHRGYCHPLVRSLAYL